MLIEVTAADVAAGEPASPYRCPIALAVRRALPRTDVCVYASIVDVFCADGGIWIFPLDPVSLLFLRQFDRTGRGEPFAFDLPVETEGVSP